MSAFSNRNLVIVFIVSINILNMRIQSGRRNLLNDNFIRSKKQSGIKLTKEIFEWKPVIHGNVKCHLAIEIWKSFEKVSINIILNIWESSSISGRSRLNDNVIQDAKEQSGINLKEIFEWKPVIYRNVRCRHLYSNINLEIIFKSAYNYYPYMRISFNQWKKKSSSCHAWKQGAKWNQADEGNIWMEASRLLKSESSSNRNLEIIIFKSAYRYLQYENLLQ